MVTYTALTGEITLSGQVIPVGGLKEKTLAAHRAGITTVLVPERNRVDIEEHVPESIKNDVRFVYVENVREVLHEVFKDEAVVERWKKMLPLDGEDVEDVKSGGDGKSGEVREDNEDGKSGENGKNGEDVKDDSSGGFFFSSTKPFR